MAAAIGAGVFSIVIILSSLIICGLPLGELTMGDFLPLWFMVNIAKRRCEIRYLF